ncbi:MAG: hypothetical protein M1838_001569 [Thelocarpon superellum]|nr:MAG: hypothetical protein M1838_001569 [Thelocarpon superellum]
MYGESEGERADVDSNPTPNPASTPTAITDPGANANPIPDGNTARVRTRVNRIRGPQSALTDFLAANNISANRIRQDFERRRIAAQRQNSSGSPLGASQNKDDNADENENENENEDEAPAVAKKRKRASEKAVAKIKAKKMFQRRRKDAGADESDVKDSDSDVISADWSVNEPTKPLPGQLENCAQCGNRFTVTPYSKAGPNGGLLCAICSKALEKEDKKQKPKKKPAGRRDKSRQMRSDLLDGRKQYGAKPLLGLCVQKVASNVNDVEDFGELPPRLLDKLSQIFSKQRLVDSRTIDLFLRPYYDTVTVYDAAGLTVSDFLRLFAIVPSVRNLRLDKAGQFKNEILKYVTDHPAVHIVHLSLSGANHIDDEQWRAFFSVKGKHLETIKLDFLDGHFDDTTFSTMVEHCRNLARLKLERLWKLTPASIEHVAEMNNLKHLTLRFRTPGSNAASLDLEPTHIIGPLRAMGHQLHTLCLDDFSHCDDDVLKTIHAHCTHLSKLRVADAPLITDAALVSLFTDWRNPGLTSVNFRACRSVEETQPAVNPSPLGLCSAGFQALMAHSGGRLESLSVPACRHISHAAFSAVFSGKTRYPLLSSIDVSFCDAVDDPVLVGIFRSCPKLRRISIFGCFRVKDVRAPRGVVLLGRPNAQDEIAIEGDGEVEE